MRAVYDAEVEPGMSARKSHTSLEDAEVWVARQGYALERATAAELRTVGFVSSLGRHYRDDTTGKSREIDLVAELAIRTDARLFAVVECKTAPGGAWIARETDQPGEHRYWQPLISETLRQLMRVPDARTFWLGRDESDKVRSAFSVVEATDESNDRAYDALAQAVSGATGWAAHSFAPAVVVPVVVVKGPLYALCHATGGDEPLVEVPWRRVLWAGPSEQTVVDVVRAEYVRDYGIILRTALEGVAAEIGSALLAQRRQEAFEREQRGE